MSKKKHSVKFIHLFNKNLWNELEPKKGDVVQTAPFANRDRFIRKEKTETESESEEDESKEKPSQKRREKEKKGLEIKNQLFSFTSFLIPICLTAQKPDYQLLYCMCALKKALKFTSTTYRKEGFAQLYMVGMKSKVDWMYMKRNSMTVSEIFTDFLVKSGAVCMVASTRKEDIRKVNNKDAPFIVLFSATDVPTPCRENLCVGTSWIVYRRSTESRRALFDREIYKCGRRAITAGLCINGCTTTMTTAFKRKDGVHHFIFDPRIGDFMLYQENFFITRNGKALSINEGLFYKFSDEIQKWLQKKKDCEHQIEEYYSRYTGGCVTDAYKILRTGGILLSPKDKEKSFGRVNLLFQAFPLSYLAEKAGGKATNGKLSILKTMANETKTSTHLFLGSIGDVDNISKIISESAPRNAFLQDKTPSDSEDTSSDYD